jgi:acyl transferase domain-containing protein
VAPLEASDATNPLYWAEHLRATVRFSPALLECIKAGGNLFLEVGPRATLATLATQHFPKDAGKDSRAGTQAVAVAMLSDQPDAATELGAFGSALARLWTSGYELPWQAIWGEGRRMPSPALQPFQRREFRYSEGRQPHRPQTLADVLPFAVPTAMPLQLVASAATAVAIPARSSADILLEQLGTLFSEFSGLSVGQLNSTFVEAGFDSLVLMQIGVELGKKYGVSVSLRELMGKHNTLRALAEHVQAKASPDKLPRPIAAASAAVAVPAGPQAGAAVAQALMAPAGAAGTELVQLIYRQLQQLQQMNELLMMQVRVLAGGAAAGVSPAGGPGALAATVQGAPAVPGPLAASPAAATPADLQGSASPAESPKLPARKLIRARHVAPAAP